jgi:hypothetical protein
VNSWHEHWNMQINKWKTQVIGFSWRLKSTRWCPTTKWGDILSVNNVIYLGVTFDRRMIWRHHIKTTVAMALCTYIKPILYSKWEFKDKY